MDTRANLPAWTHRLVHLIKILVMSLTQMFLYRKLLLFNSHRSIELAAAVALADADLIVYFCVNSLCDCICLT
jgi:hypothetical protein